MLWSSDDSEATAAESVSHYHSPSNESQEGERNSINKYMTGLKAKHPINSFMLSPFLYPLSLSVCVREFLVLPFPSESPADSVCSPSPYKAKDTKERNTIVGFAVARLCSEFETSSHREGIEAAAKAVMKVNK